MKKVVLALVVAFALAGPVLALKGTNVWKYKNAPNVSDVMERALPNHFAAHTNYGSWRAKWQAYFDVVIANNLAEIYRQQVEAEARAVAEAARTNALHGVDTEPVGD